jgi:hypothetical protein
MGKVFKQLKASLNVDAVPVQDPRQFVYNACERIAESTSEAEILQNYAEQVLELAELAGIDQGRKCLPLAAASICLAYATLTKKRPSQKFRETVAGYLDCSVHTSNIRFNELINIFWGVAKRLPWHRDLKSKNSKEFLLRLPELLSSAERVLIQKDFLQQAEDLDEDADDIDGEIHKGGTDLPAEVDS